MESHISKLFSTIHQTPAGVENEALLREEIHRAYHYIKDGFARRETYTQDLLQLEKICRKKLFELETAALCTQNCPPVSLCALGYALEELCDALDVAASTAGRRVSFATASRESMTACAPGAVLRCTAAMVRCLFLLNARTASLAQLQTNDFSIIRASGNCTGSRFHGAGTPARLMQREHSPLHAVRHTAAQHGGCLLACTQGNRLALNLVLSRKIAPNCPPAEPPDFSEYLCNRLSIVYTSLAELL